MMEYEALLLGIVSMKQREVKILRALSDAELIVRQVRAQYTMKNARPQSYRNRVQNEIEDLDAFSIQAIPRDQNARADLLAALALLLHLEIRDKQYKVEVLFRTNFPHNVETLKVFNSDKKIQAFLEGSDQFSDQYFKGSTSTCKEFSSNNKKEFQLGAEQSKGNKIP